MAQTLPDGFSMILPVGNSIRVDKGRQEAKTVDYVLAGSKESGYRLFFVSNNSVSGEELWVSDGTNLDTHCVKDIYPGAYGSGIKWITRFNDKVVFQARQNDETGYELWISDGTANGTFMIKNIQPEGSSKPYGFVQLNETQFVFAAKNCESAAEGSLGQSWLWISDGTEAGTHLLWDCNYAPYGLPNAVYGQNAVRVGRQVYFRGQDRKEETGMELWVTDGIPGETRMVKDIYSGTSLTTGKVHASTPAWLFNINNEKLFFVANDGQSNASVWTSKGNEQATTKILSTYAHDSVSRPIVYKDKLFYRANAGIVKGEEPFIHDPVTNESSLFADFNPGAMSSAFEGLTCFDDELMFKANSGSGQKLFYTDGTAEHIAQPQGSSGILLDDQSEGVVVSGSFYFTSVDGLYRMDNKEDGPTKLLSYTTENRVYGLKNMAGNLYFVIDKQPGLYKYTYRKSGYTAEKDSIKMDPYFETDLQSTGYSPRYDKLSVYPNPAQDFIHYQATETILFFEIYDNCGRIVSRHDGKEQPINIRNLTPGFYHIKAFCCSNIITDTLIKK